MPKKTKTNAQPLLDAIRPTEADGPLQSVVLATYGLGMEQPNFFEQDFLPTLLGLGGVRDRGYLAPVTLERKLAESYCALICDAHALAQGGRPSLRVDIVPLARPRHHAKVVLIHRKRLVRLVITSANLTHDGYRSQREMAAVLDFRPEGTLLGGVLVDGITRWLEALGKAATEPVRDALMTAMAAATEWSSTSKTPEFTLRMVFGGGPRPLWQEVVEAWPANEPLLSWQVCSPFWPSPEANLTPFDTIANGLRAKGVSFADSTLELICSADVAGDRARPVFPFPLVQGLRERGFPIRQGRIVPARLETLEEEVPERKAEGHRALHAKSILLRGPETAVMLLGSANFTNPGLGVGALGNANIEAGVLITCSADEVLADLWLPPLVEGGSVSWATCASSDLASPMADPDDPLDWPDWIRRIELDIHWGSGPDPSGALLIQLNEDRFSPFGVLSPGETGGAFSGTIATIDEIAPGLEGRVALEIEPAHVRKLLVHRTVRICWGEPAKEALFPINIHDTAKAGLPSILGARPDEQQLLAYFHGRIGEDDLLLQLEERAREAAEGTPPNPDRSPPVELQNYLVREFVESLFGLEDMLAKAMFSPRALELALMGDFSPASLGERVVQAFLAGRRSATATAFQLTELLRVVSGLPVPDGDTLSVAERKDIEAVKDRATMRLMSHAETARQRPAFSEACRNPHVVSFIRSSIPRNLVDRLLAPYSSQDPSLAVSNDCSSEVTEP